MTVMPCLKHALAALKMSLNIHSDSQFLQESVAEAEISEEMVTLITDGGYGGVDNTVLAREKTIDLVTTALIGKDAPWKAAFFSLWK